MSRIYIATAGALVAALLGALFYVMLLGGTPDDRFAQCRSSTVAGGGEGIGGPFELVDETGATVTDEDIITKPTLLYFGYTFCPDVCPLDNARNAMVVETLEKQGRDVRPVFVSVDPGRDTPEVLRDFTDAFHPDMIGLTGSQEQIDAAAKAYRAYHNIPDSDEEYYLVDHSTFTYLVLPEHGFVDFFRRDQDPDEIAETVSCYIDAAAN